SDSLPFAPISTVQLDQNRSGTLKNVSPGRYNPIISDLPPDTYLASARLGDYDVLEKGVDVPGGAGLTLILDAPAAELSGTVYNTKGEPVPGAIVTIAPRTSSRRADLFKTITADQNGAIRMRGIVPGEYHAFAWEDIEPGMLQSDEFVAQFASRATRVSFARGDQQRVSLTVIPRSA